MHNKLQTVQTLRNIPTYKPIYFENEHMEKPQISVKKEKQYLKQEKF